MKVKASIKPICAKCRIIRRAKRGKVSKSKKRRLIVICENPKHKQRQG